MEVLSFLLIGLISGWLAGHIMQGGGYGIVGDIIVGMIGSLIGGFLFDILDIAAFGGTLGAIIMAVIGAIVLITVLRTLKRS